MFNILMAELIWVGIGVGLVLTSWPNPPWDLLLYGGGALMIVLPFLLYPVAKALFLAFDLIFRPPEDTEPNE